ncbi:11505_t:CDS:2, partial [Dentiscutata erythropus]
SRETDPKSLCLEVSKAADNDEFIEYNVAKECIESFPFDAKFAKETIDAVSHFMSNYYAFLDEANEEPPKGFTYQPEALRNTIFKLKDDHTRIVNICYQNFVYDQNLTLYSVVTTDKEKYKTQTPEIDGKPTLQAIIEFANNSISYSKDLESDSTCITYNLKCPKKSFKLEREWAIVYDCTSDSFFLQDTSTSSSNGTKLTSRDKATESTSNKNFKASASRNKKNKKSQIKHAKLVTEDFYLVNNGTVGVAVITEESEKTTIFSLVDGLDKLNNLGVKKLILDMSNNLGGDVS